MSVAPRWFQVRSVIDGDTLVVEVFGQRTLVHLAGVDCPEARPTLKLKADARQTGVSYRRIQGWGDRATKFTRRLVTGKKVRLRTFYRHDSRPPYVVAYVFLPGGALLNAELIQAGLALATKEPHLLRSRFIAWQKLARAGRIGLWADKSFAHYADRVTPRNDHLSKNPGRR